MGSKRKNICGMEKFMEVLEVLGGAAMIYGHRCYLSGREGQRGGALKEDLLKLLVRL